MSLHTEINFEIEICEHLAANGWLYEDKDAAGFVRGLALFPADVLAWGQATQPKAWDALTKNHGTAAADTLLSRLRQSIEKLGTLHILRHGFDVLGLKKEIKLAEFKPALAMNPDILARSAMRPTAAFPLIWKRSVCTQWRKIRHVAMHLQA
jgi:type I restriction enzyme, R subunit